MVIYCNLRRLVVREPDERGARECGSGLAVMVSPVESTLLRNDGARRDAS